MARWSAWATCCEHLETILFARAWAVLRETADGRGFRNFSVLTASWQMRLGAHSGMHACNKLGEQRERRLFGLELPARAMQLLT